MRALLIALFLLAWSPAHAGVCEIVEPKALGECRAVAILARLCAQSSLMQTYEQRVVILTGLVRLPSPQPRG